MREVKTLKLEQIHLELTKKCNLKCRHCVVDADTGGAELPYAIVENAICDAIEVGLEGVTLSGGEPFVHSDILRIVRFLKGKKLSITLQTNGTLVTEKVVNDLKELLSDPDNICVSLYGADEKSHEYFTNVSGSFQKTIKNIQLLVESNLLMYINASVHPGNISQMSKMIELCKNLGIKRIEFGSIINLGRAEECLVIGPKEVDKIKSEIKKISSKPYVNLRKIEKITGETTCGAGISGCSITTEGDVFPCPLFNGFYDFCAGNLYTKSLKEIWESPESELFQKLRTIKRSEILAGCNGCKVYDYCYGGCRARALLNTGSVTDIDWFSHHWLKVLDEGLPK
ncbi:MAG: radical SAM protein [Candidatus Lokiarchaeia archaeon]